ncbi:MAG TPA: ABC transporter permease [Aggregatilineales bacterium]|nr:ABC transporter permease [Aggregatilineales bacterium]
MQSRPIHELLLRNTSLVLFVVVFLYFGVQAPRFFDPENISNIIKQAAFTGIVAVGMTFVLLTAGIDLSVGSNMYLSALFVGYLMDNPGIGVIPALIAALLIGAVYGAINAFFIVKMKIAPFIVTLATLVAGRGLGTAITESHGVEYPRSLLTFGASSVLGIPMPIIVFAMVVLGAHFVLTRTAFGRQVYAVGNDIEAARKAGINTDRIIASVYIICGMCAGLGGFILIAQIARLTQPFARGKELDVIAAAVLGGTSLFGGVGSSYGAVIGSVLIQMVQSGLIYTEVNLYLQPMVQSAIIFLAVFFDGLRDSRLNRLKRRHIRTEDVARQTEAVPLSGSG